MERFPPAPDLPFGEAVARQLRALDPSITTPDVLELVEGRPELDVRRAVAAARRARPDDVLAYVRGVLGRRPPAEPGSTRRGTVRPLAPTDDAYG